ncbi:MAG: agmatine deiminase family protein [Verrucomicrobiota bacterium]|nr:agmatine deiminase family protein [Verrucomicrobiota bacterium]
MSLANFRPRFPAEWEPQAAVWFSWPNNPETWPGRLARIQQVFAELITRITAHQEVRLNCTTPFQGEATKLLRAAGAAMERVRFYDIPTNDVWCRDHGPTFVKDRDTGKLAIIDWEYNAWGGKYPPWIFDDAVPARVGEVLNLPRYRAPLICEGGALETNGDDLLLTTESVLLNPNRNPKLSQSEITVLLKEFLGSREVVWLGSGMVTDDTDGHIDTLARFWKTDGVVCVMEKNSHDADYRTLMANRERLQGLRTPTGGRFDLVELPQPEPVIAQGTRTERLPATYANFLILNGCIIVPTYSQPKRDAQALGIIGELFSKHQVIGVDSLEILREGGSFHCLSQQQPVG